MNVEYSASIMIVVSHLSTFAYTNGINGTAVVPGNRIGQAATCSGSRVHHLLRLTRAVAGDPG